MELQAHDGLIGHYLASVTNTLQDPTVIRVCVPALKIANNLTYLSTSPQLVWKVSVPLSGQQFRPLTYLTPTSTGLITGCVVYSSICKSSARYSQLLLLSPLLSPFFLSSLLSSHRCLGLGVLWVPFRMHKSPLGWLYLSNRTLKLQLLKYNLMALQPSTSQSLG